jgi:hypothetical protein
MPRAVDFRMRGSTTFSARKKVKIVITRSRLDKEEESNINCLTAISFFHIRQKIVCVCVCVCDNDVFYN